MTNSNLTASRREALAGIALCGVAIATPAIATPSADRAAWNQAVARYVEASQNMKRVGNMATEAHEAAEAECPRREDFWRRYDMGHGASTSKNFTACHTSIVIERAKGRHLTPEEAGRAAEDAQRLVAEFEEYGAKRSQVLAEYNRLETQHDQAVDEQCEAFKAMMATPAPDGEAMRFKINALSKWLTEGECDGAEDLAAINADADRILGRAA